MFSLDQYELIDFGMGRKLERFGPVILDRPSPAAAGLSMHGQDAWNAAHARYIESSGEPGERGQWIDLRPHPDEWFIQHADLQLMLRCTPFGHLGLFPEHAANWDWIAQCVAQAKRPLAVLNLFAYTGGSTLAAAAAGASVVHVDSARNIVAWARRNAELSGLKTAPIRWIVDDALAFVRREVRRQRRYDAVILDPPSYGHGPKGQPWRIETDLSALLAACRELLTEPAFVLFTCHTPSIDADAAARLVADLLPPNVARNPVESSDLGLTSSAGRHLPAGVAIRWPGL
jgi:23S rRNA (cytosine1962-C5)-methyltransferase